MLRCSCGIVYPVFIEHCKACAQVLSNDSENAKQQQQYNVMKSLSDKRMADGDTAVWFMMDLASKRMTEADTQPQPVRPPQFPKKKGKWSPPPPPPPPHDTHKRARAFDDEISKQIVGECRNFYFRYASRIGDQFPMEYLEHYIQTNMSPDQRSTEVERWAKELIDMLFDFAGLTGKNAQRPTNPRNPNDV